MNNRTNTNIPAKKVDGVEHRYGSSKEEIFAYDRLPKKIRKAIQEGEVNWSCTVILKNMYGRGWKMKSKDFVDMIKSKNRDFYVANYPGIEEFLVADDAKK